LPDFLQQETLTPLSAPETFVARQEEISQLHKLLESVLAGQGRVAFVAGEAGSGKTTLIREFIQQAQSQHPRLVSATGYCNAFTGFGDPYLPFREVLNQLSGDIETHLKAGLFSRDYAVRLWQAVPATCQALLNFGPDLIGTIIPPQSLREYISPLSNFNNNLYKALDELIQQKQSQAGSPPSQPNIFSQCGAVLQAVAKNTPLILVLDDLQWADSGTISMLFHLGKHLAGNRILILGAYRSEEVQVRDEDQRHPLAPVLAEFKKDIGEIIINLDQSSHKDFVEELIASEPNEFDQAFHESLFLHTRGHPLFTVELIRDLQDKSALVKNSQGRWVTKSEFKIDSLPPKVEGIISERINRLPRVLQRILTVASIEGEVFTAEIIAGVEEIPVSQVVDYLSDHLGKQHRLVRAQEINVVNGHTISSYRFRHILFQKYLYSRLDEIEVVNLHGRVGSEMETLAGENKDRYSVNLARHFHHSKQIGKAVAYYAMAGERAVSMSAYPEAIGHFEESIKLLRTLPETPSRKEQELDLQLQLGLAYQAIMGFANEKVGQAYQRARELSLNVENPIKLITTLHLLLSYYSNMAEFDTGYEIMALLEQSYKELGEEDSHDTVLLDWAYGYLDHLLGQYKSAYEHFERAIAHYNPDKYDYLSAQMGMDAGIYCHNWAGLHAVWMGYPDKAKVYNRIALKIAEGHNSKLFTNDALCFSTWISLELEDIAAAKEFSEAFLELTTNEHYFFFEALAWAFKGRILFREGKHQDAIASIQKGLEMDQMTGMVVSQEIFLHALAEAYCAAGQAEDGLEVILKAEQAEEKTGDARFKSFLQRIKGELYLLTGDEVAAEEAYLAAIATAQKQSAKLLELEAVKKLARLWHKQGKTQQAIEKLAEVYNWFTEGFDTPMLVRARELLEKMKGEVKG
jgi:tetratricopeptide (TPR) repeat protein